VAGGGRTDYDRELTPGCRAGVVGYGHAVEGDANVSGTQAAAQELQRSGERRAPVIQQQRPVPFERKTAWDAYRVQFELLAEINGWNDAEKATYLAISLRGPAATVLTNLPPEQRLSYAALTTALETRFGTTHQVELNRMRLKSRMRRREEGLAELAGDIERLVRLAYPDATEPMVEVLAKDQFVDALPEEEMRLRIRQHKPASLRDALAIALELESCQLASRQRAKYVKEAWLEEQPVQSQQSEIGGGRAERATTDVLQQLVDVLRQCTQEMKGSSRLSSGRNEGRPTDVATVVCWECRERGHRRRQCPRLRKQKTESSHSGNEN